MTRARFVGMALLCSAVVACTAESKDEPKGEAATVTEVAEAEAPAKADEAPASQPAPPTVGEASPHGEKPEAEKTMIDGLENVSGVTYLKAGCDGSRPCPCRGELIYGQNALAKVGITEPDLARGVACVIGDYDGNGVADLAFLGIDWGKKEQPAVPVQVLLFDDEGLRATSELPKKMTSLARVKKGERHVLVEPGAQSRYHFAFDDDHQRFAFVRAGVSPEEAP